MNWIWIPFKVIYKLYYLVVFASSLILTYPLMYFLLSKPSRFPTAFKVMRIHAFLLLVFAGAKLKVEGKQHIPKEGAFVICPNHTSYIDIFCIYTIFKRYLVFTGKQEIEKWPLFHIYYTSGMNILVDRENKKGSITSLKRIYQEIDKGNPIAIFPEGTISRKAPVMNSFKPGAFSVAIQKQIPILPITFISNWKILQRGSFWTGKCGPGISKVVIHKPVITQGLKSTDVDELKKNVKSMILSPFQSKGV